LPCPTLSAVNALQQSTAIMSSYYPSNSNVPPYAPVRPVYAPNYSPQASSTVASEPYMPTTQYTTDQYGRQQQQPRPALPYGSNGTSPLQSGYQQQLPDRTAQTYGQNGRYRQGANINLDTPMYAPVGMTRGSSSGSYGTESSDSPQSQSSSDGPRE
jgi:hypothetical protein